MKQEYRPALSLYETQSAIGAVKQIFQEQLARRPGLLRVTAPLFVDPATGLNDDLNGVERPVAFDVPQIPELERGAEIVQSLAKWKRQALAQYGIAPGKGLYTDMNAIRRDEVPDEVHSIYVDQWDWEKALTPQMRSEEYLRDTVRDIVAAVCFTLAEVKKMYPQLCVSISRHVSFVTTQQLEDRWPELSPRQREEAYVREHPTAFIMQIGGRLKSGRPHDGRAPDYDDWTLNGDLLFWDAPLDRALEVSSMGIRVDAQGMRSQCAAAGCAQRLELPFHRAVLQGEVPLSIGGGIGQSRLCMLLLGKAHIGEVQASLWPGQMIKACGERGIPLL